MRMPTAQEKQVDWGILVPWKGSKGIGNELMQFTLALIVARIARVGLNMSLAQVDFRKMHHDVLNQDLDPSLTDPQLLLLWLMYHWPYNYLSDQEATLSTISLSRALCAKCASVEVNVHECATRKWSMLREAWRQPGRALLKNKCQADAYSPLADGVTVHFRCSPILWKFRSNYGYGFLPMSVYKSVFAKLGSVKHIRLVGNCFEMGVESKCGFCEEMAKRTANLLEQSAPGSKVTIYWNRPVADDFLVLACSQVTICSISTFCFFAALLAGRAFIPRSAAMLAAAPDISGSVEWFEPGRYLQMGVLNEVSSHMEWYKLAQRVSGYLEIN